MTSLAKQLQRLAVPFTQTVLGEDKRKASLLFDPKEAANLDRETYYALGINGLEELENIDGAFQQFEDTLFNESSQSFERSVQTKEVNDKLDQTISEFLIRVSPYFLLRPAQKAMEWLIYRYHIHQYNVDNLILCVLPYHETNMFVRVIQLLKLSDPTSRWNWIEGIQKPGVPLARSTVITHCYKDPSFLTFICEMGPKFLKVHGTDHSPTSPLRVVISFYASTVVGALQYCDPITDSLIAQLMPHLVKGLKSKSVDYKAASYMIASQLTSRTKLKTEVLTTLLPVLTKHVPVKLSSEALACVAVIFQSQKLDKIPKKSFKHLCKLPGLVQSMCQLSSQYILDSLLSPFLDKLVPAAVKDTATMTTSSDGGEELVHGPPPYLSLLEGLLGDVQLKTALAQQVIRSLLDEYIKFRKNTADEDAIASLNERMKGVVRVLEQRYPILMDTAVEEGLKKHSGSVVQGYIEQFVSLSLSSVKHQILPDSRTSLLLSLNHPQGEIRKLAVTHLAEKLTVEAAQCDSFYKEALVSRLQDDQPMVVLAVLKIGEILWQIIPPTELFGILQKVLQKGYVKSKWRPTLKTTLELICSMSIKGDHSKDTSLTMALLPHMLVTQAEEEAVDLARTVLETSYASQHTLFKDLKKAWCKMAPGTNVTLESVADLNECLIDGLNSVLCRLTAAERRKWVTVLVNHKAANQKLQTSLSFITLMTLSAMMEHSGPVCTEAAEEVVAVLLRNWKAVNGDKKSPKQKNVEATPLDLTTAVKEFGSKRHLYSQFLKSVKENKGLPEGVFIGVMYRLISSLKISKQLAGKHWWAIHPEKKGDDLYLHVCTRIFDMLTTALASDQQENMKCYESLLQLLFKTQFDKLSHLFKFLAMLWTSNCLDMSITSLTTVTQARALRVACAALSSVDSKADMAALMGTKSPVIPSLLVSLTSVYPPVREAALIILGAVKEKCPADASPYMVVVSKLVHAKEELITDQHHLSQTLGVLFSKINKAEDETGELLSPKKEKSKAKKGQLQTALGSLLHCVVSQETPRHVVTGLLKCLKEVHSEDVLNQLLPVMQDILHKASTTQHYLSPNDATSLELILTKFNAETSALLARNDQSVKLFLKALQLDKVVCPGKLAPGEVAIKQITKEFFSSIPSADVQQQILCALIDLWTDGSTVATATLVTKALKGLSLQGEQIALELNKLDLQAGAVSTVREAKRARRMSRPNVPSEEDTAPMERRGWRRVTLILEMLQNKKKVKNIHLLIPIFFGLISKLFEVDDTSSTEYVKQLLLSCILHACQKLSPDGKPIDESLVSEKQFNVELLVQCIRSSDNPQTHRHALLLLSMAAGLFPDHVLHNIMAVFTFMGANIMRQDDAYSFQVITKTLETVIPALIKASEQQEKVQNVVSDVLRVFVDASPHIPDHRRLPLFTKLAETVGTEKFLWTMVVQLLESHITKGAQKTDEQENKPPAGQVHQDIEFCLNVVHNFSPRVQVVFCHQLLQYLAKLPQDKEEDTATTSKMRTPRKVTKKKTESELFDTETHTAKQLRHFKYTLTNFISVLLSSETFISQIVELEETDVTSMQPLYQTLLEEDLRYITQVAHCLEAHAQSNTAKFWRALLHKGYDILEKVNALLPGNLFVTVVTGLMQNELATVRRKAMDMLNNKLQQQQTPFTKEEQSALLNLIDKLVSVAAATNLTDIDGGEEQAVNRQTALYSLKLLCKCLGKDSPAAFTKLFVLSTTIFLESGASTASPVSASALLLLAELCSVLKAHAIPFLPRFMPGLLKVLQNEENLLSNDLLLLSAVTTLHKVVESLPHFLSPYLEEVLLRVVQLSCLESEDHHKSQLHLRLRAVRHNLSTVIAPRVLLPAVTHCFDGVVQQQKSCIIPLMSILEGHLSSMSKDDLNSHHNQIVTFFLTALDFRMNNQKCMSSTRLVMMVNDSKAQPRSNVLLYVTFSGRGVFLPMLDILKIEECVIKPVIAMIMRLSETTFRPMFFKLFDWATRLETTKDRLITFYRLGNGISEKLKGLFSLFAGHIVKNSANILNDNNTYKTAELYFGEDPLAEEKASQLLQYVLDCLHKIFLYDTDGFLNKERFDTLMQPLADQLENLQGGEGCYESRVNDHLVPCIAQFAIAAGDDGMWKPLNYQVLLKTRNISAKVRFAALRVIEEFNAKLGEEYMTLLPETIPFLAELMEDESEEVEHKCQEVVTQMEKVLGEPIQKYF